MANLSKIFIQYSFFDKDQDMVLYFIKIFQPLFEKKDDITQELFTAFYDEYLASDINYESIVSFFQEMLRDPRIKDKRQKYLFTHWLYYQAFKVKEDITQEGTMKFMKQILQKKENPDKTIDNIASHFQFSQVIKQKFKLNIQNSSIYKQFVKQITPSQELNPLKIQQKHNELIFISEKMNKFGSSLQQELQKHILVSFEKAYGKTSELGAHLSQQLIQIPVLQKKIDEQGRLNDRVRRKFDEFKTAKDEKGRYSCLQGIKSQLTILDVFLLNYLICQAKKHSQQENGKKIPKNIALLVGPSGSGKTTIILRLLGYKLEQTQIQQLSTLQPIDLRPQHSVLRTSPESTSTTRYMFSAKLPSQSFMHGSKQNLQACDSPGFQDTAGCEVDISNSISIQNFLKSCASVKLCVVISQRKVGDKMEGIRQIANIVSNLVVKYSEIESDVLIILNKFDNQKQLGRLRPGIQSILKSLNSTQKGNTEYIAFLRSFMKKLKNIQEDIINFDPTKTDIPDLVSKMQEGAITNPREIFKYSLSTKSNQCISNRKITLLKNINESLGKDNNLALYYLQQLILFKQCLNNQVEIELDITNLKNKIKESVTEKAKTFYKKVKEQVQSNDANKNTFNQMIKIKEDIKSYEIFSPFIQNLATTQKIQEKLNGIKQDMFEKVNKLQFSQENIEQSKKKVVNMIKFLAKFDTQRQKQILQRLQVFFRNNIEQAKTLLLKKDYVKIRGLTINAKNILDAIQKGKEAVTVDPNNPERLVTIDKKEIKIIEKMIDDQFESLVNKSTKFIQDFKQNKSQFEINSDLIQKINSTLKTFEQIEAEGPILGQIYAKRYKDSVVNSICAFGKQLIDELSKIVDPNNNTIKPAQIQYLRHNKTNTRKLTEIKEVYGMIGAQIDRLWGNFSNFISIETKKLNDFLSDLKNQKQINRNTLRNFKSMIDRILKFSQGDDSLIESTNQLKYEIKRSIAQHIKNLKTKIDKIKISLQLKKTIQKDELVKVFQKLREIEAFHRVRQLSKQDYYAAKQSQKQINNENIINSIFQKSSDSFQSIKVNQSITIDDFLSDDEDDDKNGYEDINISQYIKSSFKEIVEKILNPFSEIKAQSSKINKKWISKINSNYLQFLNDFLHYKAIIQQYEINQIKEVKAGIAKLQTQKQDSIEFFLNNIIGDIKKYFDQIYAQTIEEPVQQQQIYMLSIEKIKQFKKATTILLAVKKYTQLQEVFVLRGLGHQYLGKVMEILNTSYQLTKAEMSNKKRTNIELLDRLNFLSKSMEELKYFDELGFEEKCNFTKIFNEIVSRIKDMQGKQSNAITNLFKDQAIIMPQIKKMYNYLLQDSIKNEDNIMLIQTKLQQYGDKLSRSLHTCRQEYLSDQTMNLDNQHATIYINRLEKAFKFYEDLKQFVKPQQKEKNLINQQYLTTEIGEICLQERLKFTYEILKDKLNSYDYKTKQKEFEKIIASMKKAQYVVEKVTKDSHYSICYNQIEDEEEEKNIIPSRKFTLRLIYFKNLMEDKVKNISSSENTLLQFVYQPNFLNFYSNLPSQQEKQTIDAKLEEIVYEKMEKLENSYEKTDQQKKNIEEDVKKMVEKIPILHLKKTFKNKLDQIKSKLKEKEENEVRNLKQQLKSSEKNVFQSLIKFQQCRNPVVEKQFRGIIMSQLKNLTKDMLVIGNNKRICLQQSFKRYLKNFGSENSQMIKRLKSNEKITDLFSSQQSTFLRNFTSQMKQMIRQIQSLVVRCSTEGLENFTTRLRQMNQIYLLALKDDYDGVCPHQRKELISVCEQYIIKFNQRIQRLSLAPQIDIKTSSSIKIEKIIVEWKFVRIFINIFIQQQQQFEKLSGQKFLFAQEWSKKFKQIKQDSVIMNFLLEKITALLHLVQQTKFYDEQIKILNLNALQSQFQNKLINSFKMLSEFEQIYNKHLCEREQDRYSKDKLIEMLQTKWDENMKIASQEFENALKYPSQQISQRIITLHKLTQIVTNRRWDIIDKQLKSKQNLQEFLQSRFNLVKQYFNKDLQEADSIIQHKKKCHEIYQQKQIDVKAQCDKVQQQENKKKEQLQAQIAQIIDEEAKEKRKLQLVTLETLKQEKIKLIRKAMTDQFEKQRRRIEEDLKNLVKNIAKHLIIMAKIIHSVSWRSRDNQTILTQFLQKICMKQKTFNKSIYEELHASKNNYALIIAADAEIFKSQAAVEFKNKTSTQGIQYIIQNCPQIKNNKDLAEDVQKFYNMYLNEYNQIIDSFKSTLDKELINTIAKQLKAVRDKNENRKFKDGMQSAHIIAQIFAIWSMTKMQISNTQEIQNNFEPHPAQIVAIYLLIGNNDANIENSLVEVLTGQGKSIVLAGLCIFLAIKGYRAYCACYSEYLSSRDESEFKNLFDLLGVSQKIKYGTFNQHCEDIINESSISIANKAESKNFRQSMKSVLNGRSVDRSTLDYFSKIFDERAHQNSKKILIIDEADVFFNQNFFGQLYCPSLSFDDQSTKKLIEFIWRITKESRQNDQVAKVQKQYIYNSEQFKKVAKKYPAIDLILKNQVIGMLQAVYNFNHQYIIHQDSIKYRDNDAITDKISFGYKTVFANCYEYERKAINQISYESALKITLSIAPFSYSQLPKFFQSILGVSGTVSSMSDFKKQMLSGSYGIKDTYRIPSIYGESKRTNDNFTIVENQAFYNNIVEHTKKVSETSRPVALFFKTIKDVTNFYKSPQFKQLTKITTILTEQTEFDLRQTIIKRVGQRGKITILTESFARGTDFKMFDKAINEIGGLHVIQAFISSDLSEYIQTRGRTARQGNKGSFEVLVKQTQLERIGIQGTKDSQFQQNMKNAWIKKDQQETLLLQKRVDKAREKHLITQNILKKRSNQKEIIQFIYSQNKFNQNKKNHVRTLIGIDGTASMGAALRKVFDILEDSFNRTKTVLYKKNIPGSFQNKIGVYRNYDCEFETILEYSGYETDGQKLKQFLKNIQEGGGWENEAMEVLFDHANKQKKLDQIIIIADARANTGKDTIYKRASVLHGHGEKYWLQKGLPLLNEGQQVFKLKQKGIKIHTLYINLPKSSQQKKDELKKYCNDISEKTGGYSQELKLEDSNASQFLTGFLVKNILLLIGGQQNGQELVESYNQDFPMRL